MAKKKKADLLTIDLYCTYVYMATDTKALNRLVRKTCPDTVGDVTDSLSLTPDTQGYTAPLAAVDAGGAVIGSAGYIMFCNEMCPNTIAHEATHVAMEILYNAGVPFNGEDQEALAYLVGHITEEFHMRLEDNGSKEEEKLPKGV